MLIRSRWSETPISVRYADGRIYATAPCLTGRTGIKALRHAISAVMGDTWKLDHETPGGTLVFVREEASDA